MPRTFIAFPHISNAVKPTNFCFLNSCCSFPIKYCWCLRLPNTTYCSPVPEIGNQTHTSKKGNITCTELTEPPENGQIIAWMNFTIPGLNGIMANFSNMVDCQMQGLNFTVYSRELLEYNARTNNNCVRTDF